MRSFKSVLIPFLRGFFFYMDNGTSLRDQFAASALTGLLANTKLISQANEEFKGERANEWFTETAFAFADGMIKSRLVSRDTTGAL